MVNTSLKTILQFRQVWGRLLLGFIPILLIPICIMLFIYIQSITTIEVQTYEANRAEIKNDAKIIEMVFESIENLILYLEKNQEISTFILADNPAADGTHTIDLLEAQKSLNMINTINPFIDNIQIYSDKSQALIDSTTTSIRIENYYGHCFSLSEPYMQWREKYLLEEHNFKIFPNQMVSRYGYTKPYLVIANSVQRQNNTEPIANIFVYIKEELLLDFFHTTGYRENGFLCILDNDNQVILQRNCSDETLSDLQQSDFSEQVGYYTKEIDNNEMFITFSKEDTFGLTYITASPKSDVLAPTRDIRITLIVMIICAVIGGLVVLFMCSIQLSYPIVKLFNAMDVGKISYDDFASEISNLTQRNKKMQIALQEQVPLQQAALFYNLILDDSYTSQDIRASFEKIGIASDANFYIPLIVCINDFNVHDELSNIVGQKIFLKELFQKNISNIQGIYDLDFERIVLLVSSNQSTYDTTVSNLELEVASVLSKAQSISLSFAADICQSLENIPKAFYHAQTALEASSKTSLLKIQWHQKAPVSKPHSFSYTLSMESDIIVAVKVGDVLLLTNIFEDIQAKNETIFSIPNNLAANNLIAAMHTTWVRILNDLPEEFSSKAAINFTASDQPMQDFYILRETFFLLCNENYVDIKYQEGSLQEKLHNYVQDNFCDPQICLTSVADEFHITEVYLSRLFKKSTNENFSKQIEKLRMDKAKELQKNKNLSIAEIAQEVGYNSPQVFRRAYKRQFGVTPSESSR